MGTTLISKDPHCISSPDGSDRAYVSAGIADREADSADPEPIRTTTVPLHYAFPVANLHVIPSSDDMHNASIRNLLAAIWLVSRGMSHLQEAQEKVRQHQAKVWSD